MNFTPFSPEQKVLINSIINKVEHSGCTSDEIVSSLTEVLGLLLANKAPSKADLSEYLDDKLLPYIRRVTLDWYDVKHIKDEYGNI